MKKQTQRLEKKLQDYLNTYHNHIEELNKHQGKRIDDVGLDTVNSILKNIQESFKDLYPLLTFIVNNHALALTTINHYAEFIDIIKKQGAQEGK